MLNNRPSKEIKISIADIVISLKAEQENLILSDSDPRQYFVTKAKPDLILKVRDGPVPEFAVEELIFDTFVTWKLFRSDGYSVLKAPFGTLVLNSDLKRGDIYLKMRGKRQSPLFPLTYPIDEILMINLLSQNLGLMLHACGLTRKGRGVLFPGTSGAGKSTIANLWKLRMTKSKLNNEEMVILSDDRVIVRRRKGQFWIYGTPWHGDARVCSPEKVPLERVFFLKHAKKNVIEELSPKDVVASLIVRSFSPFWDKKGMAFTLDFCTELAQSVPCYELGFVPNESAVEFIESKL